MILKITSLYKANHIQKVNSVYNRRCYIIAVLRGCIGSKKADGVLGVCVVGCRLDRGRWSRISWLVWLVVTGDIDSKDRNVVKGDRVQLRAGRVVSEGRNVVEGKRVQ